MCIKEAKGKIPIAGTGSNSTDEAISLTKHAEKMGADGVLVVTLITINQHKRVYISIIKLSMIIQAFQLLFTIYQVDV